MPTTYEDILTQPVQEDNYLNPAWGGIGAIGKKKPRVAAKRDGLPVDANPHDHTLQGGAATQTQQTEQQQTGTQQQEIEASNPKNLAEILDVLNKDKVKKDEDIAKREAALKRAKKFTTIGDALSAFHTAYSNARGVQSMVPAGTSLSGKWRERYDNLMKEKDANEQAHLQNLQKLQQMKDTADYQTRSLSLREREEDRRQATAKAEIEYKYSRADAIKSKADLDAAVAEAKIELMRAGMSEKEASAQAKLIVANSTAAKNYAQAEKYRSGGEGKTTTTSQTKTDSHGRTTTTETTQIVTPAGQSGKKPASNNTPPSRQNAKKNVVTAADDKTPPSRRKRK